MMKELIAYILQFGQLNAHQIDLISTKAEELTLRKEAYFSEAGKIARQIGFVVKGVVRICYYNNKGEEVTKYFIDENNLLVDLDSFNNEVPSPMYVQAVTDCELMVFSKQSWDELLSTIAGWDAIVHKITSKALLQKIERRSPLVTEDATTRYLTFLEKFPNLVNRIPLSQLASYLGITRSSLSRIRRSVR